MAKTFLDTLTEFPAIALKSIGSDKEVVALLLDNPTVNMDSEEADSVYQKFLFDYDYVDQTCTEAAAYICVEAELAKVSSSTIDGMNLYVTIRCHKKFMKLNKKKFKSVFGNRKDNLARRVDAVLNGSDLFGIGSLQLTSARTVASPAGFSSRELSYRVPTFKVTELSV